MFAPKGNWMRPTTDRVREFIFSYFGSRVSNARGLDLFAGTGSLGIEALSRGAEQMAFVDASTESTILLRQNLEKLAIDAPIYRMKVEAFLKLAARDKNQFDLIFCDPPYNFDRMVEIFADIKKHNLLAPEGSLIYESSSRSEILQLSGFLIEKEKKLGDTRITIYSSGDGHE